MQHECKREMTYIGPYIDVTHEDDERNEKVCMLCMLLWTRTLTTTISPSKIWTPLSRVLPSVALHTYTESINRPNIDDLCCVGYSDRK